LIKCQRSVVLFVSVEIERGLRQKNYQHLIATNHLTMGPFNVIKEMFCSTQVSSV
jgi:hypothetical protein